MSPPQLPSGIHCLGCNRSLVPCGVQALAEPMLRGVKNIQLYEGFFGNIMYCIIICVAQCHRHAALKMCNRKA